MGVGNRHKIIARSYHDVGRANSSKIPILCALVYQCTFIEYSWSAVRGPIRTGLGVCKFVHPAIRLSGGVELRI